MACLFFICFCELDYTLFIVHNENNLAILA